MSSPQHRQWSPDRTRSRAWPLRRSDVGSSFKAGGFSRERRRGQKAAEGKSEPGDHDDAAEPAPPWRKTGTPPTRAPVRNVDERGLERLDDRIRTPAREPSGRVPDSHPGLARLLSCHDDELFRKKLMQTLPSDWETFSKRQKKRLINKFRKAQHKWRFEEPGEFRSKVLCTMSEAKWYAMYQDQQRSFWHSFRYGDEPPEASGQAKGLREPDDTESPEQPRAAGILRSRPRSASPRRSRGSHHRRVCGLSSEEL